MFLISNPANMEIIQPLHPSAKSLQNSSFRSCGYNGNATQLKLLVQWTSDSGGKLPRYTGTVSQPLHLSAKTSQNYSFRSYGCNGNATQIKITSAMDV